MSALAAILLAAAAANAPRATPAPAAPVEIHCTDARPSKPPLLALKCDVTLHNDKDELRWFAVPSYFYEPWQPRTGGVDGIAIYRLGKTPPQAIMAELEGTAGAFVFAVAPHADVTVRGLGIEMWGRPKKGERAHLEAQSGTGVRIGEKRINAWFPAGPQSDLHADVSREAGEMLKKTNVEGVDDAKGDAPVVKEQPLSIEDREPIAVEFDLP